MANRQKENNSCAHGCLVISSQPLTEKGQELFFSYNKILLGFLFVNRSQNKKDWYSCLGRVAIL
jgi:hypothetical protein